MSTAACDATTLINSTLPAFLITSPPPQHLDDIANQETEDNRRDGQLDIWTSIQEAKKNNPPDLPPPYIHPMLKRSASFLSQKSLEVCTESLGSETGSDGFSDLDPHTPSLSDDESETGDDIDDLELAYHNPTESKKELAAVNYHCSGNARFPPRSFPPPLPSISRRDGPCLHMSLRRHDGRLVVHAMPVPSQNYLHCDRQDGRLLLSFIETAFEEIYPDVHDKSPLRTPNKEDDKIDCPSDNEEYVEEEAEVGEKFNILDGEEEEEEEDEEVEVVDRGTTVEVKVSRQPQPQSGGGKVHKSSLVINKFVVGTPLTNYHREEKVVESAMPALVVETTGVGKGSADASVGEMEVWGYGTDASGPDEEDDKQTRLLFSAKRMMKRQELLYQVNRCSQNKRSLFIWEPCCIATS